MRATDDLKVLFSNPGVQDVTAGGERQPASGPSVTSSSDQERFRDLSPGQLCPVQPASASGHSLKPPPGPDTALAQLPSGEIVCTETGEVVNVGTSLRPLSDEEIESEIYAAAPEWSKRQADKYLWILRAASGHRGAALRQFIAEWNEQHPNLKTSYDSVLEARKKYAQQGVAGLLAQYGHNVGLTKVQDEHYKYFKDAYLKEGGPSTKSCWTRTLGYARNLDPQVKPETFPSPSTFLRRLEREIPKSSIYLARHGHDAWNRKYASYVDRDYSKIEPGQVIVSDHCQLDIAVMLSNGRVQFPWVTAWRDFKTGMWLSWFWHLDGPTSDHVFLTFYYAVRDHGLPTDIYIDNGKDYRCRDFAGGRKRYKVLVDKKKVIAPLALLNVAPHFALPYGAQTKPIERDFGTTHTWFDKHLQGYRGPNVVKRPEILDEEIKSSKILPWDESTIKLLDNFITQVLNKMPSNGKVLQGRSREEAWGERTESRKVGADALKLFCMRTSREVTIGRNGIRDSELQVSYWAEFMYPLKGTKVYLRRDPRAYQTAWVFDAATDEYLGKAELVGAIPALAKTDIEKAQLKAALAQKNRDRKIAKAYFDKRLSCVPSETVEHLAAGVAAVNEARGYDSTGKKKVKIVRLANTAMDRVVRQDRAMQKNGTYDISVLVPPEPPSEKPIFFFESDARDYEVNQIAPLAMPAGKILRAGILEMDLDRQRVKAGDVIVDLLPMEFRLLHVLMSNRGKVYSRAEIKNAISRSGISMELRAIDVHVTRLRTKLQKAGAERYILTKRGSGYFYSEED